MRRMVVIVAGFLLGTGAASAQTAAAPAGSTGQTIIPVTVPSVTPSLAEPPKPEMIPIAVPADTKTGEIVPKAGTGRATQAGHPAPRTVKVAHKPGTKSTVKKTSTATTKHVAKTTGSAKAKHVAGTKQKAPTHHTMVGKPIPVTKHQPAAKGDAPAQPLLPRV